jgi:hypothetical protein
MAAGRRRPAVAAVLPLAFVAAVPHESVLFQLPVVAGFLLFLWARHQTVPVQWLVYDRARALSLSLCLSWFKEILLQEKEKKLFNSFMNNIPS